MERRSTPRPVGRRRGAEASTLVASTADATLALLYWRVGRRIHADVLAGDRAAYGAQSVVSVARQLGWIARVR
jgi:hypothetical protein